MKKKLKRTFFLLVFFVLVGTYAYHQVEGWRILNSLYFVIVTISTIGYGDFVPHTDAGKIFTMFFSFFGVTTALYLFSVIGNNLFKKHLNRKVSEIKKEVQKQQEIKQDVKETIKKVAEGIINKKTKKKKH